MAIRRRAESKERKAVDEKRKKRREKLNEAMRYELDETA